METLMETIATIIGLECLLIAILLIGYIGYVIGPLWCIVILLVLILLSMLISGG